MKSETDIVVTGQHEVAPSGNLLEVIANAVADPRMDVEKMERLLAMHQTIVSEQRRTAFMAAMSRLTPKLPEIQKNGTVAFQGRDGAGQDRKYARLEDIDRAIRPLIAEEGFSLSFDTVPSDGKCRVICKLSHREGHSETKQIDLPLDSSGSKNGVQAVGSTVSYGRRMLVKMFFNLIEAGEDTNGLDPAKITEDQARDIECKIQEVGQNLESFLRLIAGADKIENILARDFQRCLDALETKRKSRLK